tara:strand:- start:6978 stop:7202 length:225 start_codon:yes stop_codon:yes gene_type:complete
MLITIHIEDKEERIQFAQSVRKILGKSQTYIPTARKIWKTDIGVKASTDMATYMSVIALINRRGYNYKTIKEYR